MALNYILVWVPLNFLHMSSKRLSQSIDKLDIEYSSHPNKYLWKEKKRSRINHNESTLRKLQSCKSR